MIGSPRVKSLTIGSRPRSQRPVSRAVDGNAVPFIRATTLSIWSSCSRVAGGVSCRSQAFCPYSCTQRSTTSRASLSCTPRWWVPVHRSSNFWPSSACQISGGRSSIATVIPTWLTGAFVSAWIARSGPDPPRNNQISPVLVSSSARDRDTVFAFTTAA